jgi:dTMP kinase
MNGGVVKRGTLIVFEGIDGCGKSTQLRLLADRLSAHGVEVVITKEPTEGKIGKQIRAMAQSGERVAAEQELAWFMEDRREHVSELLAPKVEAGAVVLCDRYSLSTTAYQGARGLDAEAILRANEEEFPIPDLALIFEISAAEGLARVASRGGIAEPVFEEQEFLSRAERVFASLDRPYIERIDARPDPDTIQRAVVECVRKHGIEI